MWEPSPEPFTVEVRDPEKKKKFKGMKSFTAYRVVPSVSLRREGGRACVMPVVLAGRERERERGRSKVLHIQGYTHTHTHTHHHHHHHTTTTTRMDKLNSWVLHSSLDAAVESHVWVDYALLDTAKVGFCLCGV